MIAFARPSRRLPLFIIKTSWPSSAFGERGQVDAEPSLGGEPPLDLRFRRRARKLVDNIRIDDDNVYA